MASHPGVYQRHRLDCDCPQEHRTSCPQNGPCKCPREHTGKCEHRIRPNGRTTCGCPWAFTVQATRAGRRTTATGSGFTSMSAAARARQEAIETLRKAPAAAKRGDTLEAHLKAWVKRRSTGSNAWRASTRNDYARYVAMITEAIGGERLRDVDVAALDAFEAWMLKHHPGAPVAHARAWAVVQSAIRDAYRRGLIADDPTRRRDPIRAPKRRRAMLTPDEFARLYRWAEAHDERLAPLLWVAATTGLRRGELAGLRWIDVDLDGGKLIVTQQAVQVGSSVHVGAPKTAAGEGRVVVLDSLTISVLRAVQARQNVEQATLGAAYDGDGMLVFADEIGRPYLPEVFTRALPRLIERYNEQLRVHDLDAERDAEELARLAKSRGMGSVRLASIRLDPTLEGKALPVVTFHSLRHLAASIMLASGRSVTAVQRRLGHSSVTVTSDIYGHLIEATARADAEAAAALISTRSEREA